MKKRGLTLVEILATIGILSLIILTLLSTTLFIVRSSTEISKTNIVKSKLTYYYFDTVFVPYFLSKTVYDVYDISSQKSVKYEEDIRKILEEKDKDKKIGRIYAGGNNIILSLKATDIFYNLQTKIKNDEDIKNWGIEIISVELSVSEKKPISSVIVEDPPKSGKHKLIATLLWFDVIIKYKTKDGRVLTLKTEFPLINNVDSGGISLPPPSTTFSPF